MARKSSRTPRTGTGRGGYATIVTSALLVSGAVAIALLGNIRLKDELNRLETEIGRLDREVAARKRSNRRLLMDYETLVSSAGLNSRMQAMRLDLVMPGESARVILPEPLPQPEASHAAPMVASRKADDRLAMNGEAHRSRGTIP